MRTIVSVLGVVAVSLAFAGCGGSTSSSSTSSTTTNAAQTVPPPPGLVTGGTLTVCGDVSFPPLEFFQGSNTTNPVGFDVDMSRAVAKAMGLQLAYKNTAFTGLLPALSAGRCDVVWSGLYLDPTRLKAFDGVGYLKTAIVILTKAGNPARLKATTDLAGRTIAFETGTVYGNILQSISKKLVAQGKQPIRLQGYPKQSDAVAQVIVGRASGVVTQDTEAAYRLKSQTGQFSVGFVLPAPDSTFGFYFKKDPATKSTYAHALAAVSKNGAGASIASHWGLKPSSLVTP